MLRAIRTNLAAVPFWANEGQDLLLTVSWKARGFQRRVLRMRSATCAIVVLLSGLAAAGQSANKAPSGPGMVLHRFDRYGFALSIPSSYHSEPSSYNFPGRGSRFLLHMCADKDCERSISITLDMRRFSLESLQQFYGPTGVEDPPQEVTEGAHTFYYYGTGGGGVLYPDQYFFDLRGHILTIFFDGPSDPEFPKTPSLETKRMEERVLRTFRLLSTRRSAN
jgi:hypothetical protein